MERNEFDNLAVRAVRRLEEPNEQAWAKVRPKTKKDWFPSWREIGFATAIGGMTLLCLATLGDRQADIKPSMTVQVEHRHNKSFQSSFVSINRLSGVPASIFGLR